MLPGNSPALQKKIIVLITIALIFFSNLSFSQLVVTPNPSIATLVSNLAGQGLTVTNAVLNCPSGAYGTFNGTSSNIGIANGILLTTGSVNNAVGPNNSTSSSTCNGTQFSDPQLTTIEPQAFYDPCIFEFDIVPQCNTLQIRFVFGSEEYPEFVNSSFNDAFGFFITGPGPACQPGFYNNTNVATLPNNVTPVSIDNVSPSTNSGFYFNNTGGATIQYDGFTVVLTRNVSLCPCQTYHFKIAIADAGDCVYDSGVFLDFIACQTVLTASTTSTAASCSCTGTATVTASGSVGPYTYNWAPSGGTNATATGLCAGTYTVTIDDALSCTPPITATVVVSGSGSPVILTPSQTNVSCFGGSNGTASVVASGAPGPYTYVWNPNVSTTSSASNLSAGNYTVTVTASNGCTGTQVFTITQPSQVTATQSQVNILCNGQCNGTASVVASGGTPGYTYNWSPSGGNTANATGLCAGNYTCTIKDANLCTITKIFTISQPSAISATQSQVNILCNGQCNGTASVVASGGTPGYFYNWSPSGGNLANATGLCFGNYTCTITDANGCTITKTFVITQPTALTATQSQVNILCNGQCNGTASVVASGGTPGYTYNWTPSGGNTANATGLCSGNYTCTITDANGCTLQKTFVISQPTALTATQSQVNVLCNGQCTGTASVVASGGTPGYSYNWTPSGGNAANATGLCNGNYTCTITDANGCTITKTFTVTQPTVITLNTSATQATCGMANGTASVVASGGTPGYTYNWAPSGGTTANATGLTAGSYTVTVTDANGCTRTATVIVPAAGGPSITITSSTNVSCFGGTNGTANTNVTGGTPGYTYNWTPSGGTNGNATGLGAGNYTVTVTDANGCSAIATVTITQPTQLTATITASTNVLCNGNSTGSATVTASGGTPGYTYNWAPSGGTGATGTGLAAGNYTVTVTDANGCTRTATITITQPTLLNATQAQTNATCNGSCNGTASVTASGGTAPYSYNWTPSGGTNPSATGLCAGTYTCTITDANGCTITRNFTITQPTVISLVTSSVQSTCGQPNGSASVVASGGTPGYSYSWAPSGGSTANASNLTAGNYTVFVTDANGCTNSAIVIVSNAGSPTLTLCGVTNVLCFGNCTGGCCFGPAGGTPPYIYSWNTIPVQTTATATGLCAGNYTLTLTDANGCSVSASTTITQPMQLTASVTASVNVLCFGGNNGSATVTANGGTVPYTYNWSPSGGTNATASNLTAGNYSCVVTDANGCTVQTTISILQPTQLTLAVAGFNATCNGSCNGQGVCIPSGGSPNYSFSWAPSGGINPSATGLCAGIYTVYVTDVNGCTANDTAIVNQPAPLVFATTSTTAHCNQSDGSACANVSGGVAPYSYAWSPGGQTVNCAAALFPGTYTVTVTDFNGCTATTTVVVPNAPGVIANINASTNVSCFGICDGTASVTANGGTAPYAYNWSPSGGNTNSATGLCAGTYTCTVTDVNGCSDTAVVTITQPQQLVVVPGPPVTICIGQNTTLTATITGGTGPYTPVWTPSGPNVNPVVTTTYTITVTDANGCTSVAQTITVTVNPPLNVVASAPVSICIGGNTTITATGSGGNGGPYSYVWTPGNMSGSSVQVFPTVTTTYTVAVTDNCGTPTDTASVTVIVNPLPVVTFTTNPSPAEGCAPLCVNFSNTTPNTSQCDWNFSVGTATNNCSPSFCFTSPGTYDITLSIIDNNGCANSLLMPALVTVWPNPVADFTMSPQPTTIMNPTIQFTDQSLLANTWTWSFGDILNSGSNLQNPSFTYTDSGTYTVTLYVTSIHGCVDSIQKTLRIDPEFIIYVPNAFTPNEDGKNDAFFPQGMGIDESRYQLWIFDRWGNNIWYTEKWRNAWDGHANDGNDIAQEDVYVWKIVLYDIFGEKHSFIGHVSLIR